MQLRVTNSICTDAFILPEQVLGGKLRLFFLHQEHPACKDCSVFCLHVLWVQVPSIALKRGIEQPALSAMLVEDVQGSPTQLCQHSSVIIYSSLMVVLGYSAPLQAKAALS